jgi:hypothetical protein
VSDYTIFVDGLTADRLPAWQTQLENDPTSIYVHYLGGLGWDDHHNAIASINATAAPPAPKNLNCSDVESGWDYDGNDLPNSPVPAASQEDCCGICNSTAGCLFYSFCTPAGGCGATNCYLKTSKQGRMQRADRLSGPANAVSPPSRSVTLSPCPSHYEQPGFDALDNAGTYYSYNILAELDSEGEFYVNRTSQMLLLWPPANSSSAYWQTSPWGKPVVGPLGAAGKDARDRRDRQVLLAAAGGAGAAADTPIGELSVADTLLSFSPGTGFITIDGVTLTSARNVGVLAVNATSIVVTNSVLENFGNMAVNASGGSGFFLGGSVVRHAGDGAIFFYAGDRQTLTAAGHTVFNSSVSYSNRYMYCYVPSVALADCGNSIVSSELYGGPHQGTFISGNNHRIVDSLLHDLVEAASDSGTVYMGRDWTYQGNVISGNTFVRINTADPGDDVSAVYLDDMISGFTITNNTFLNVSRALLLGGGRDIIFANNSITGVDGGDAAVHFDNRGMGWSAASCTPPDGELVHFLARVPYNTSAVWIQSFPHLINYLNDEPCVPKNNIIVGNTLCNGTNGGSGAPFLDQSNATIVSWGSTAWGNTAGQC